MGRYGEGNWQGILHDPEYAVVVCSFTKNPSFLFLGVLLFLDGCSEFGNLLLAKYFVRCTFMHNSVFICLFSSSAAPT